MAAKAVDARKRSNRNRRFRGHGPLLQFVAYSRSVAQPQGDLPGTRYSPQASPRANGPP